MITNIETNEEVPLHGFYYRLNMKTATIDKICEGTLVLDSDVLNVSSRRGCLSFYPDDSPSNNKVFYVYKEPGKVRFLREATLWLPENNKKKAYNLFYEAYKDKFEKTVIPMAAFLNNLKINKEVNL